MHLIRPFAGLRPGTYRVDEAQPAGYLDGKDTLGSLGGTVGPDRFLGIGVGQNVAGVNYNFGELKAAGHGCTLRHHGQTPTTKERSSTKCADDWVAGPGAPATCA